LIESKSNKIQNNKTLSKIEGKLKLSIKGSVFMMNLNQAIILALDDLGGEGTIKEVNEWIQKKYPNTWKDVGTSLADMVPKSLGGNSSSTVSDEYRVLERISPGKYRLYQNKGRLIDRKN
jgi:hypothetical protein